MTDSRRKAKITKYQDGSGDYVTNVYFHKWGDSYVYNENEQKISITVGIIEFEDGTVKTVAPITIKFVESF